MKITVVYNPKSGGSYHRVKLWSEFVENVTLVEDLTEDHVKDCDILYIHWNSKVPITTLSIWREKYGFKVIADIDDVWQNTKETRHTDFLSQHLCLFADQVICSTEYLVQDIMNWNKNVKVIPNLLPVGHGQFTPKTKVHKKIRVGIGGSISHFEDYMSLRGLIKRLESKDWFQKNYEFVIIGYNNLDQRWRDVNNMFKNVKLFKHKSPEDYMSLYDELDIMLLPLLDTEMNRGRSELKIYECLCKGVIPIISKVYHDKGTLIKFLPTEDWEENIKNYQDKIQLLSNWKFGFLDGHDYNITCIESRKWIFNNMPEVSDEFNHNLYSITYSVDQDVEYRIYRNDQVVNTIEQKSYLFEYNPIIDIVNNWVLKDNYTAFFSHKFPYKTGFYKKYVEDILNNEDSDVVILGCKQISNYLEWTEEQHPGFMDIFIRVCQKLELVIPPEYPVIYSNFFAAKANVYKEYVKLLKRAIDIMETDLEIRELCWKDANYKSDLSKEDLKKYTGLDFYTFHTFILERLISIWIVNKGLSYAMYT